jgi:hypothetical protein
MLDNEGPKMRCNNGQILEEREVTIAGFTVPAMVCPDCGFVTLTKAQAKRLQELQKLQELMGDETEIRRFGESLGILLPRGIASFGIKEGQKARIDLSNGRCLEIAIETSLVTA